jgi:hypothetical protein
MSDHRASLFLAQSRKDTARERTPFSRKCAMQSLLDIRIEERKIQRLYALFAELTRAQCASIAKSA